MYKKIIILISLLLPLVAAAQTMVGSWKFHTPFSSVNSIVETPEKTYFVSAGSLFSYDKENQETYSYNTGNVLNDSGISQIYYNKEGKYLLVTYTNGNMDFIYDNGNVVNMSDIKDAVLTSMKTIHGVSFVDNKIYIATEFGVVIADEKSHTVKESGIYHQKVNFFTKLGDHYLISLPDKGVMAAKSSSRINNLSNFTPVSSTVLKEIIPVSDRQAIVRPEKNIVLVTFDFTNNSMMEDKAYGGNYPYNNHGNPYKDGYYFTNGMTIAFYNTETGATSLEWLSSNTRLYRQPLALWNSKENLWTATSDGIANVEWKGGENVVYLIDYFKPGEFTVLPVDILLSDNFGRVYATTTSITRRNSVVTQPSEDQPYRKATNINIFETDGSITKLDPDNMFNPYSTRRSTGFEPLPGSKKMAMGNSVVAHPKNPDIFFASNRYDGLYKLSLTDGCVYLYDQSNSKILWDGWQSYVGYADFDRHGNLWVAQYVASNKFDKNENLLVLPADKVDKEATTPADWSAIETDLYIELDPMLLACKKSNIICLYSSNGDEAGGIVFYDSRGTATTADDRQKRYTSFIDQDGKMFSPIYITCITELENGKLWVGTDDGIIEIANPESMLGEGRVTRIKVPRNDGTGLADYLMGSQMVLGISMDASKNKWIATQEGGLFKVSADGRSILRNFTKDNSPLTSNKINTVQCSPVSNVVYIGTDEGIYEYQSDSAPAEPDYSSVLAYPNPVRPDFTGYITVKGLMDNSLIKITDSAGNIVSQGKSEGGMYTWDGCNFNGERVRTGVYFVYASQSGDAGNSAVVTKIMIVR
ncbi:MAG: hypothetical protein K2O00_09310 [Muribaculaceae bacterium]|nr:hypothetical protein [Muribaculaceae bacterium]